MKLPLFDFIPGIKHNEIYYYRQSSEYIYQYDLEQLDIIDSIKISSMIGTMKLLPSLNIIAYMDIYVKDIYLIDLATGSLITSINDSFAEYTTHLFDINAKGDIVYRISNMIYDVNKWYDTYKVTNIFSSGFTEILIRPNYSMYNREILLLNDNKVAFETPRGIATIPYKSNVREYSDLSDHFSIFCPKIVLNDLTIDDINATTIPKDTTIDDFFFNPYDYDITIESITFDNDSTLLLKDPIPPFVLLSNQYRDLNIELVGNDSINEVSLKINTVCSESNGMISYDVFTEDPTYFGTELIVYPNPSNDIINVIVHCGTTGKYTFQIYDLLGKIVYNDDWLVKEINIETNVKEIDLSGLNIASGSYYVLLKNDENTIVKQIIYTN